MRTKLAVLGEYVGHLVVGAALFAALLFFGVALHLLADWAETEREVRPAALTRPSFVTFAAWVGGSTPDGGIDGLLHAVSRKIIRELRGDE